MHRDGRDCRLVRLPDGITGRVATSSRFAVATTLGEAGDVMSIVDLRPESPTRLRVIGLVPLRNLANGPVPGQPAAGREGRAIGIAPRGRLPYITGDGEGTVSLVDVDRRRVTRTIQLPTSLSGGGHITVVRAGTAPVDLVAR